MLPASRSRAVTVVASQLVTAHLSSLTLHAPAGDLLPRRALRRTCRHKVGSIIVRAVTR